MKRRQLLVAAAGGSVIGLAGCMDWLNISDDSWGTIQALMIVNPGDDPVTVQLKFESPDTNDVIDGTELTIEENVQRMDCIWPDQPLVVSLERTDSGRSIEVNTSEYDACIGILFDLVDDGIGSFVHRDDCPIDTARCHIE